MMNRRLMDFMRNRDGRNPYGSRGGYVVPSRRMRDRGMIRDCGRGREINYNYENEMGYDGNYEPVEIMGRFKGYYNSEDDYARRNMRDYNYNDYRGRGRDYGYMPYQPYMMDYASQDSEYLSDRDLEMWADKLMRDVEEKDKQFLSRENIRKRANEMGIKFDKYSFEEFYVVVLMSYTDHCKTLGTANMDIYLKLAKDFLEDEDSSLKYGERLAAYYDFVING